MSKNNIQELRGLSDAELNDKIVSLKQGLIKARLLASSGRLEKPSVIKNAKREIARIITIQKESYAKDGKNK